MVIRGFKGAKRWVWLALCRRTRQVVVYWVGDCNEASAVRLWKAILNNYRHCASFSDQWRAYELVFNCEKHQSVDKTEGQTNHVERWFNTLRQRLLPARFTRKTLSFSKRDDIHTGLLRLFIQHHNSHCISQQ